MEVSGWALRDAARRYARDCFSQETQPQVNELASLLGFAPYELSRRFADATGENMSVFLKHLQLARARRLLRFTNLPLNHVGYTCGFGTRTNFFRAFKRLTGATPQQFRNKCRKCD